MLILVACLALAVTAAPTCDLDDFGRLKTFRNEAVRLHDTGTHTLLDNGFVQVVANMYGELSSVEITIGGLESQLPRDIHLEHLGGYAFRRIEHDEAGATYILPFSNTQQIEVVVDNHNRLARVTLDGNFGSYPFGKASGLCARGNCRQSKACQQQGGLCKDACEDGFQCIPQLCPGRRCTCNIPRECR